MHATMHATMHASRKIMNLFPAILIGGPPNSGKSILFYSLVQALRRLNLPSFYGLRAAPDGEGLWTQEVPPGKLIDLRFKGAWSQRWIDVTCRDLAARTMPLLVDVGGRPTPEQEVIFDQCTHAVLLVRAGGDSDGGTAEGGVIERQRWRALMHQHGLPIIADLESDLHGENRYAPNEDGSIGGALAGLHREQGGIARGPAFEALAARVHSIFNLRKADIDGMHLGSTPQDAHLVNYKALARDWYGDEDAYLPEHELDQLVAAAPPSQPLAVYGAKPAWLCTALGAHRTVRYIFDARQGWVQPPALQVDEPNSQRWRTNEQLDVTLEWLSRHRARLHLQKRPKFYYLDYSAFDGMIFPYVPPTTTLLLNGPMPMWLFAALGHAYRHLQAVVGEQAQQRPTSETTRERP